LENPRWRTAAILKKPLNRHNSAVARQIAMKFGMMTHKTLFNLATDKKLMFFGNQDGSRPMRRHARGRYTQRNSAKYRTGTVQMLMGCILAPPGECD